MNLFKVGKGRECLVSLFNEQPIVIFFFMCCIHLISLLYLAQS